MSDPTPPPKASTPDTPGFSPEAIAERAETARRYMLDSWAESYAADVSTLLAALEAERVAHEETRRERAEVIEALAALHVRLDEMEEECRYWQDRTNQYGGPE